MLRVLIDPLFLGGKNDKENKKKRILIPLEYI